MSIDCFVTYTTEWHEHQVWALIESLQQHHPDTPVYVLNSGSDPTAHPAATNIHPRDLVGAEDPLYAEVLSPQQRVLALLPRALMRVMTEHDTAVFIEAGCVVVGPLVEIGEALTKGDAVLVSPMAGTKAGDSLAHLHRFMDHSGSLSHRLLGLGPGAAPALQTWVDAMLETFFDTRQRMPSEVHLGLASAFAAMADVGVAKATFATWEDLVAIRAGGTLESHGDAQPAVIACDELFRIARETALGRYQSEEVAWGMVAGRVHDAGEIAELMEPIQAGVEKTELVRGAVTPLDELVCEVWRSADPYGLRWPEGKRDELLDWLYASTTDGLTRIGHLYWHLFLRGDVRNPREDPTELQEWNHHNALSVFGADLFDRSSANRAFFPEGEEESHREGLSFVGNALAWRWNAAKEMIPGWKSIERRREPGGSVLLRTKRQPRRLEVPSPSRFDSGSQWLTLMGALRSESGLGQASRATFAALEQLDRSFSVIDFSDEFPSRNSADPGLANVPKGALGDVNLIHANPEQILWWQTTGFRNRLGGRYNVGFWFWETAHLPRRMQPALDIVDELWVSTNYLGDVFGQYGRVPVHVVGLAAELPEYHEVDRSSLGLKDDEFVFLFVYDAFSAHGRKNPEKLLQAFRRAFGPAYDGVRLVLKASNLNKFPRAEAEILGLAADTDAITVIDRYLSRDQVLDLMAAADIYVSLHAAEGYGLTLLEAMALGTPCITTAYSGNMEFTTEENSWLVDYTLTTTMSDSGPYPPGSVWAEPSIDHAAQLMREAFADRAAVLRKGQTAREAARENADPIRYAERLDSQLRRVL